MRTAVRSIFFNKGFICSVRDVYDTICDYITREWIGSREESVRGFATDHDIDEKTARRIRDFKTSPYKITLYTLEKICTSRKVTLEEFFSLIKR
jgi:hypothetical protein